MPYLYAILQGPTSQEMRHSLSTLGQFKRTAVLFVLGPYYYDLGVGIRFPMFITSIRLHINDMKLAETDNANLIMWSFEGSQASIAYTLDDCQAVEFPGAYIPTEQFGYIGFQDEEDYHNIL